MRVLYWGTYDAGYVRNRVIIDGLRLNGIDVTECHVPVWSGTADKVRNATRGWFNPGLLLRLVWAYVRLLVRYATTGRYDVLMVGYAGHLDVFPARVLAWLARRPLVFDVFLSVHETVVDDRHLVTRDSVIARLLFWVEKAGCSLADLVLVDTDANVAYFSEKYNLPQQQFARVWVGADQVFRPMTAPAHEEFIVLYFGGFIPLHGIEHIIEAARLLQDESRITFKFIGDGQTYPEMRALAEGLGLTNVDWGARWLPSEDLTKEIASADACLGIFGTSAKALRVIPTKAYIALAMGKPLITEDSPAARELLTEGDTALLCRPGDALSLSRAIHVLANDSTLQRHLASRARGLFEDHLQAAMIGKGLSQLLRRIR